MTITSLARFGTVALVPFGAKWSNVFMVPGRQAVEYQLKSHAYFKHPSPLIALSPKYTSLIPLLWSTYLSVRRNFVSPALSKKLL